MRRGMNRRGLSLLLCTLCLAALTQALTLAPASGERPPSEYEVKAAFIYNFARFIQWPEEAFDKKESNLELCVLGDDPFGPALDAMEGKTVKGRKLRVRRFRKAGKMEGCHFLFVGASEKDRLGRILKSLVSTHAVTVGDMEGFARAGGTIQFVMEANRVRFIINAAAADRAGLRISSKMLRLARSVIDEQAGTEEKEQGRSTDDRAI